MNRRELLSLMGTGFGTVGMSSLLAEPSRDQPLSLRNPHFPPRAKHVIFLFLNGGLSQVDTFDPKPALARHDGEPLPGPKVRTDRASGTLMRSPFGFRRCGESGIPVSEIFPRVGDSIDDFCVIRSMHSDIGNHEPSLLLMSCGHQLPGHPSMGSWITYGLGSENENLPGFVVLCPGNPIVGPPLWSSGFLPNAYQGTHVRNSETSPEKLVQNVRNQRLLPREQERQLALLTQLNRSYLGRLGHQPELESGIAAMEVAFRMQMEVPHVFDITRETESTRSRYGDSDFGRGCLMALRLVEQGVRMVQVFYGSSQPWDSHDDIQDHRRLARVADGPIAALVHDLKLRGLFEETLVIVGSEFGRTPMIQNSGLEKIGKGRDHNVYGYSTLLAGGGIRGGCTYGATDDFGYKAVENPVHPNDLHATVLHLLGLDHTRLTYRYSGRDFRLTDVGGKVLHDVIAVRGESPA